MLLPEACDTLCGCIKCSHILIVVTVVVACSAVMWLVLGPPGQYFACCMCIAKFPCGCIKLMRGSLSWVVYSQVQADVSAQDLCESVLGFKVLVKRES